MSALRALLERPFDIPKEFIERDDQDSKEKESDDKHPSSESDDDKD